MAYQMRGMTFDQFELEKTYETMARTITEGDVSTFAGLSGDYNPLHTDELFMQSTPFGSRIAHGMLGASVATGLANQLGLFEGTTIAVMEIALRFTAPIRPGDTVRLELTCVSKKETSKGDKGICGFNGKLINQRKETVIDSDWKVMLKK